MKTGVTLTLNGTLLAPLSQVFILQGTGAVVIGPNTPLKFPEWLGAKGDNSTDDTTAIQNTINSLGANGGTVQFGAKTYKVTSVLTISTKHVQLTGGTSFTSIITTPTQTGNMITVAGTAFNPCTPSAVIDTTIAHLSLVRSAVGTAGYGVSINLTCGVLVDDVVVTDSFHGFLLNQVGNPVIKNSTAYWTSASASPRYGWDIDTTTNGSFTVYLDHDFAGADTHVGVDGVNVRGIYVHGGHVSDIEIDSFETAAVDYGEYIDCTSSLCSDMRITNSIHDRVQVIGHYVKNATNTTSGQFNIIGGNIATNANNAKGVVIDGASFVNVTNVKVLCSGTGTIGISLINSSFRNNLIGNLPTGCVSGIDVNSGILNNITGNIVTGSSTDGIKVEGGANGNNLVGNVAHGAGITNGLNMDATTGGNQVGFNTFYGATKTIINAGLANQIGFNWTFNNTLVPTLNVASCGSAALVAGSTNTSMRITGLPTGACSIVVTFGQQAADNEWVCTVQDYVTPANPFVHSGAASATTATISGTSVSGDGLRVLCGPH